MADDKTPPITPVISLATQMPIDENTPPIDPGRDAPSGCMVIPGVTPSEVPPSTPMRAPPVPHATSVQPGAPGQSMVIDPLTGAPVPKKFDPPVWWGMLAPPGTTVNLFGVVFQLHKVHPDGIELTFAYVTKATWKKMMARARKNGVDDATIKQANEEYLASVQATRQAFGIDAPEPITTLDPGGECPAHVDTFEQGGPDGEPTKTEV